MNETKRGPNGEVVGTDGVEQDDKVIWKYPIAPGMDSLDLPRGATLLHVDVQGKQPMLWAFVDPSQPVRKREVLIVGTGIPFEPNGHRYVGSFTIDFEQGPFVGHVFEVPA